MSTQRPRRERGQIIVIAALALVAIVGMTGLVIDGGALFAQQRVAQNGSDASATAGSVVIAESLGGASRTGAQVYAAIDAVADANGLLDWQAEYTDDFGELLGIPVTNGGSIPAAARGVQAGGSRDVSTTFSRVFGFDVIQASADATVVAGALSGECVADENGCALLPVTFPVHVFQCDAGGNLLPGSWIGAPPPEDPTAPYWPTVGAESLPTAADPDGDTTKLAILPLCRGSGESSGTFGWLDLMPGMNLAEEINGPLTNPVDIPDWFQTQTGNPNSVETELEAYIHKPVFIPLHNGACREDPGDTAVCSLPGVDPVGNNTWYYVHTLAVFYIHEVHVQGSDVGQCASPPGGPLVPVTNGTGFLGCLKGWFVDYVTAGPIVPGGPITPGQTAIGIQLIK
jgi:Putative Flp pilus-assembly TadE/G-like